MLVKIREQASGWLAWVIVIVITIPFALWGVQSYFEGPSSVPVAVVNGEKIELYDYQNALAQRRNSLIQQAGGNYNPTEFEAEELRREVVQTMVTTRVVNQYVSDYRYYLRDEQLRETIETTPAFLTDGEFDFNLYIDLLRSNGITLKSYEASIQRSILSRQISSLIIGSAFLSDREVDRLLQLADQMRTVDYVLLPANRFEAEIQISDEDAEQNYQNNLSAHEISARIKVDYIELRVDDLVDKVTPSEAEINENYEQNTDRYKQAETRKASHILFRVDADGDDAKKAEVRAQAEQVLTDARTDNADFTELAKEHSDDPGSKDNGGDLGVVTRGQMVAPFEEAVFDMTAGEIRGLIETQFGYHIIKLTELTEERQKMLDEVSVEVANVIKRTQAEKLFAEISDTFQNLVFENPDDLTVAAEELGLEIKQTDWFTENSGEGIASEEQVRRAAFEDDVIISELNSVAIELGFEHLLAIHKNEYESARVKLFDEVKSEVIQILKAEQSIDKVEALGEMLAADLNSTTIDWAQLLEMEKLESMVLPSTHDAVTGNLTNLGDAAFGLGADLSRGIVYSSVALDNGDYAIYALKEVILGNTDDSDDTEQRTELEQQMLARSGNEIYQQFLKTIVDGSDLSINDAQVQRSPETIF